jgi:hypothetical protein
MKMLPEHFDQLKTMIVEKVENLGDLQPFFHRYEQNGGNWKMRFRWDMLYAIPYELRRDWFDEVYKYANDDHIDTALRNIMKDYM